MSVDRKRLDELLRKSEAEGLTRPEAEELDELRARIEKRPSMEEEKLHGPGFPIMPPG